ncbi:MAG: 6-carboxytetrahydropterin synthase QueD [Planctomycetes bacterium]|nr:6-carboxytetrahydropterin synthase QueD [Planctomycetota bacterium]
MYRLSIEDRFAAAHNLRNYEGDCERLHGHNWRVRVEVGAAELDNQQMVLDFREMKALLKEALEPLDHEYLNETPPFDTINPTTESLCRYIAERLGRRLPERISLRRVECWESENCGATYLPPRPPEESSNG